MKTILSTKSTRRNGASSAPLQIRSILVPLDFSPSSEKALEYAWAFARQFDAKLTLLHVVEPIALPDLNGSYPLVIENEELKAAAKQHLDKLVRSSRIPRESIEKILVRFGRSFHEIADAARTRKADLIIIPTHGYTGLKHVILGSTTERVVRHASCPVLVMRAR